MPVSNTMYDIRWLLKMAWRDSRRNYSRLLLFGSSVILGIAALVAVYSLGDNLRRNIDVQAATLIGADLELSGNKEAPGEIVHIMDSVSNERSEERSFASMITFLKGNGSRLIQVRALKGDFPYYGTLETVPVTAQQTFRRRRAALVDKTLMLQYDAKPGDSIQLGEINFVIEGSLSKAPGQTGLSASIAPVVYIPMDYLEQTGLMQKGSRITYRYFMKFDRPVDPQQLIERIEPRLDLNGFWYETIESEKEDTGRSFRDLTYYLEIVGMIALLLGCIGVASAIHIYVKEKIGTIAVLRCLGAKSSQSFLIFLLQIIGIGTFCSVVGAALGTVIQKFLPLLIEDLIPFEIESSVSWPAIGQGIALGVIISILFALLPLVSIRKISPLNTLRISFQHVIPMRDPVRWLVYGLIVAFIYLFMYLQLHNPVKAVVLFGGILVTFLVLTLMAKGLMWLIRTFFPASWNFVWRQGLSNLYRPNNQTLLLLMSIGFGASFICTLFFVQSILVDRVKFTSSGDQPNIVLFDIQTPQRDEVLQIAKQHGLPVRPTVPIVNMRLEQVNNITAAMAQEDTTKEQSLRLFSREYRVTFRDSITSSEKVVEGEWKGSVGADGKIFISIEKGFASRFGLKIGDTLSFNVQGVIMETYISSFREVEWNRIQANFLVVFPKGVLEDAPQFHVFLTHAPTDEVSARFQRETVKKFPNISIIDLALVLNVLDDLLDKIAFVIRFIAAFSILTGVVVLISSVLISKYQRMQENVLLRTLGASGKQILWITALEYFFLGSLAAATGIIIALGSSWALAKYSFESPFSPEFMPVLVIYLAIAFITVVIGLLNSRGTLNRPPLEILRQEV
ncbi:MAG: FtsX-like permease family protein [Chitinophagaceae bacterium]|nr:FtsX-like permease family protein [Chitinophagaceae bacterium]